MRRIVALATLLLLSLSRFGATEHVRAAVATVERPTREMVASAPSVRLAHIALRESSPRGAARLAAPWHPSRADADVSLTRTVDAADVALPQPADRPVGPAHRLTYDATAPPRLS